jgi:hypothetical protein
MHGHRAREHRREQALEPGGLRLADGDRVADAVALLLVHARAELRRNVHAHDDRDGRDERCRERRLRLELRRAAARQQYQPQQRQQPPRGDASRSGTAAEREVLHRSNGRTFTLSAGNWRVR